MNKDALRHIIETGGVNYHPGTVSFIFDCPRCNKPKLYIHKENGRFICFHCVTIDNFRGKPEYALSEIYNLPVGFFKEKLYDYQIRQTVLLKLELQDIWDYSPSSFGYNEEINIEAKWEDNVVQLGQKEFEPALEYLRERGLNEHIIQEYDIRYNPDRFRVLLPVKANGVLYGWQGRYIKKTEFTDSANRLIKIPKILTSTGLKKERFLMFQDSLEHSNHAILTEGPFDAIKCHWAGGGVASMGKAVSDAQFKILKDKVNKVYLGIDPDAVNEVDNLARKLYGEVSVYLLLPPKGRKDLGEASFEEVYEAFLKAPKLCGQIHLNLK